MNAGSKLAPAGDEGEAGDPGSAVKRRRRSQDRDVSSAGASPKADGKGEDDKSGDGAGVKAELVNGATTDASGAVKPEAAFWSALEDSKDEVCFAKGHGLLMVCVEIPVHSRRLANFCLLSLQYKRFCQGCDCRYVTCAVLCSALLCSAVQCCAVQSRQGHMRMLLLVQVMLSIAGIGQIAAESQSVNLAGNQPFC